MRWKVAVLMVCTSLLWSAPALAETPESSSTSLNEIEALSVDEAEDGTYIRIRGTEVATFSVFKLDDPPRLFVDLSNSELVDGEMGREVYNGVISEVGVVEFEDSFQEVARLVVGFEEPAHYDVRTEGNDVVVFIDGDERTDTGQMEVAQRELQQREAQLDEARSELEETERQYRRQAEQRQQNYQQTVAELEQTQSELESARAELEQLRNQRDEATGEARREIEESIDERADALEDAQKRVDQLQQTASTLEAERDEHRQRYEEAKQRARRAEQQYQKAQQRAEKAERQAERAQQEAEQARKGQQEAQQEVADLQQRLEEMDREVDRAEERIAEQQQRLERAERRAAEVEDQSGGEESEELAAELRRAQQRADEARAELREARAQRQEWQTTRQEFQEQLEGAEQRLEQARTESRKARAELEQMEREHDRAHAQLEEVRSENEQLSQAVAERDEEIAELKQSAQPTDPDAIEARAVPVEPAETNAVRAVRLETSPEGRSQIVVDLDRPDGFTTRQTEREGRSVMILNGVELPEELEQTLSSETDGGAVRFVSSYEDDSGQVHMEADLRGEASEIVRRDGDSVVWEFAPEIADQAADGVKATAPIADAGDSPLVADADPRRPEQGDEVTAAPPQYPRVVLNPSQVNHVPGMGTQPITIDLRNADIENVLRLISSETGVNIIAGDDVSGAVTMKLQGVAMQEAFLTILQSLQLGYEIRGNVIRVAPQSVLAEEEEQRAEARARAQEVEPLEVFLLPVNYASAGELTEQVEGLLSPRGSVSVDQRTNTLIIKDLSDNLQSIRMLIETLDSQVPQVLIEARIVETNENFDREIGIQWGGDFTMSQGSGNPTGLIFPNVLGMSGGATDGEAPVEGTSENPNYAVNLPATAGTGAGGAIGLTMGSVGGAVNLNMRLSAMEAAGYAKIISAPRILTLDNREATINQGTSIPISVVSAAGVQTIFVDATLELTVTPHVTPDGNVRMAIEATKNEPDFQNTGARGDPTIIQNQAETELLVADGDTTVIGGIYTENTGESISAVPFLHRIPILGFLFRNHSETENRSELLIFITPRIVNRAEALGIMSGSGSTVEGAGGVAQ